MNIEERTSDLAERASLRAVPTIQTKPSARHLLEDMHPALARRAQRALYKHGRRAGTSKAYADAWLQRDARLDGFDEERIRKAEEKRARKAYKKDLDLALNVNNREPVQ